MTLITFFKSIFWEESITQKSMKIKVKTFFFSIFCLKYLPDISFLKNFLQLFTYNYFTFVFLFKNKYCLRRNEKRSFFFFLFLVGRWGFVFFLNGGKRKPQKAIFIFNWSFYYFFFLVWKFLIFLFTNSYIKNSKFKKKICIFTLV